MNYGIRRREGKDEKILITGKNSYLGNAVEQYILDRQTGQGKGFGR